MAKVNDRVELLHTSDPHTHLKPGAQGKVVFVDSGNTVHVLWDDNTHLGLLPREDRFRVLSAVGG